MMNSTEAMRPLAFYSPLDQNTERCHNENVQLHFMETGEEQVLFQEAFWEKLNDINHKETPTDKVCNSYSGFEIVK